MEKHKKKKRKEILVILIALWILKAYLFVLKIFQKYIALIISGRKRVKQSLIPR